MYQTDISIVKERQAHIQKSVENLEHTIYGNGNGQEGMKTILVRVNTKMTMIMWGIPILILLLEFLFRFIKK